MQQIEELQRMNEHSLAYELLVEVKASAKRWFIIAMVELAIILGTAGVFVWYLSLPVEETKTVTQETSGDMNTMIGIGDNNGFKTDGNNLQEAENGSPQR